MRPGKLFVDAEIRLETKFFDDNGDDTDPDTVLCKIKSPRGVITTYTYLSDDALGKASIGDYYLDVTPDMTGRWFYRWEGTGNGTVVADEGNFLVQASEFETTTSGY